MISNVFIYIYLIVTVHKVDMIQSKKKMGIKSVTYLHIIEQITISQHEFQTSELKVFFPAITKSPHFFPSTIIMWYPNFVLIGGSV